MLAHLLQSDWLIQMLEKSSNKPLHKLANLFDVLDDHLSSPIALNSPKQAHSPMQNKLQVYLSHQAKLAGAKLPEMLANQLYFMALSACTEKQQNPSTTALKHAKLAAQVLIHEQTKRDYRWGNLSWSNLQSLIIPSLALVTIGLGAGFYLTSQYFTSELRPEPTAIISTDAHLTNGLPISREASPSETAAIYARLETMKHGDCRLLEAIQLPDRVKSIYIENIVNGHVSVNRDEQIIVNQLLDQVQCSYTPKLMANSKK